MLFRTRCWCPEIHWKFGILVPSQQAVQGEECSLWCWSAGRIAGPFCSRFHTQPPLKFRNVFSQCLKYYEAQHFGGKENDKWEKCGVFSLSERSHSHKKWTVCANSKRWTPTPQLWQLLCQERKEALPDFSSLFHSQPVPGRHGTHLWISLLWRLGVINKTKSAKTTRSPRTSLDCLWIALLKVSQCLSI